MREGWETKPLGDVCHVIGGGTPPKDKPHYYTGDIPWATVRDMKYDFISQTEYRITMEAVAASATNVIPAGNVVIATRVGLGKVCLIDQPTAINQDLRGIIPKNPKTLSTRYLFWWLKSISHIIQSEGTGATVQGVKLPFLKGLRLPLPNTDKQRRIVAILDKAFEAIATAKSNVERNLKNALKLFESYREEILSNLGDDWEEALFSDLCDIKHGYAFEGKFFTSIGDYVLLTPGNFFEGGGYRDRREKQKYFAGQIPAGYVLAEGGLLVAMTEQAAGLLGSPLLVPEAERFLHNQRLGLVVGKPAVSWVNEFFFHVLNLQRVRNEIHASASGVKVRHTSPSKIGAVSVFFPKTTEEQRSIASNLFNLSEKCDQLVAVYESKLDALDELKKSLLHQAFTGELTAAKTDELLEAVT